MTDETIARELTIRGHVQGVCFRDSVRREAERGGVAGWAANRPDGSVEVVLQGPAEEVARVVDYCRHGPRAASVEDVQINEREPQALSGFQIR